MSDAKTVADGQHNHVTEPLDRLIDTDPLETAEWLESLQYVIESKGRERAAFLLSAIQEQARLDGVELPLQLTTPYVNTIPRHKQPPYPGNREIERRIKSIIRWNAMAMVVRANRESDGIGGHISTFASSAPYWRSRSITSCGDAVTDSMATPFTFRAIVRQAPTLAPTWKAD